MEQFKPKQNYAVVNSPIDVEKIRRDIEARLPQLQQRVQALEDAKRISPDTLSQVITI